MSRNIQRQTLVCEREGGAHAAGGVRGQGGGARCYYNTRLQERREAVLWCDC